MDGGEIWQSSLRHGKLTHMNASRSRDLENTGPSPKRRRDQPLLLLPRPAAALLDRGDHFNLMFRHRATPSACTRTAFSLLQQDGRDRGDTMATITDVFTIAHVAKKLGEDPELLQAIVNNDDNLSYGSIISVYDGTDEAITALTEQGLTS